MGKRSTPYVSDTERKITDLGLRDSSARLLPPGSVILSSRAPIGHLVINTVPMATNQGCKGLVPSEGLDVRYLYYYLSSIVDLLNELGSGATFKELSGGKLKEVPIPVAPFPEQQRIVAILDEVFEGIATAKANAEKNLQSSAALFDAYMEASFAGGDCEWEDKTVGELVETGVLLKPFDGNHGEIHPRKSDYVSAGVPFIMACDLRDGIVDLKECKFISRSLADSLRVGFAKDGDVLISHKGTIGRSAILKTDYEYIMLTPQVTAYRVKAADRISNKFLRYFFMSAFFQRQIIDGASDGATRAYIGITRQLSLRLRFPHLSEQERIVQRLDLLGPEAGRLAANCGRKLTALDDLKKSLLYHAFSGQL